MSRSRKGPFTAPRVSRALTIASFVLVSFPPLFASAQTNIGVGKFVQSYDPASFGRRLTFALNFFAGSPTQETCATTDTTTADNTRSANFQVGFLPLRVSITDADNRCEASGTEAPTNDVRESTDGAFVFCSAEGGGRAASEASTDSLAISPFVPGSVVPGLVSQIQGPSDRVTIRGVGVRGTASGGFVGGAINPQGTRADAQATVDVDIEIFNPNPYAVPLHLSRDVSLYAAAGNE